MKMLQLCPSFAPAGTIMAGAGMADARGLRAMGLGFYSRVIDCGWYTYAWGDAEQAVSHFTWEASRHTLLVCDVQVRR